MTARKMVAGQVSPAEGARRLWIIWTDNREEFPELVVFAGLHSEWDDWHLRVDRGDYAEKLDADMVEQARALLSESS